MFLCWILLRWIKFSRNASVTWWKSSLICLLQLLFNTGAWGSFCFLLASTLINLDLFEIYCLSDAQSTVEYAWTLKKAWIKPICVFIELSHWHFIDLCKLDENFISFLFPLIPLASDNRANYFNSKGKKSKLIFFSL